VGSKTVAMFSSFGVVAMFSSFGVVAM